MATGDALPVPRKNVAYRVTFPILDADGDLVTGAGAATPDSEISKDGGTFTDCTNELTEIATNSGMYYLDLTSTEMNADCVALIIKCAVAGAKTVPIVLYPQDIGEIKVDLQSVDAVAVADIARGTVGSGSTTTSIVTSACNPAGAATDQFKGRIITFDNNTTTAALRGQATDITASSNAAAPTFTVSALSTAPVSGDTFAIT